MSAAKTKKPQARKYHMTDDFVTRTLLHSHHSCICLIYITPRLRGYLASFKICQLL